MRSGRSKRRKRRTPKRKKARQGGFSNVEGKTHSRHVGFHEKDAHLPSWVPGNLPPNPRYALGLRVRNSSRWYDNAPFPTGNYAMPYITETGKYSGHKIWDWNSTPDKVVGTLISTVYQRLFKWALKKNNKRDVYRATKLILRCAVYYTLSKNNYFMDRALFLLKNLSRNNSTIHKLVVYFSLKLDDSRRFVYSHACLQAQWLTFRAVRPRDKSSTAKGKRSVSSWLHNLNGITAKSKVIYTVALESTSLIMAKPKKTILPIPVRRSMLDASLYCRMYETPYC